MEERSNQYYHPYFPSDTEEELSDYESQGSYEKPDSLPRPENAEPDDQASDPRFAALAQGPDFAALAQALLLPTTGPTFSTDDQQLAFSHTQLDKRATYGPWTQTSDLSGVTLKAEPKNIDTVVMIQSIDRDKSIYPLPTSCQLFLPRDYKNVVTFSIVQINLICSFFYFSAIKQNLAIQIAEKYRIKYSPVSVKPSVVGALTPTIHIRQGTYNITNLLAELQLQLNNPPLFYDFINGFNDFYKVFVVNGDFSLNFNFPGDSYYDSLHQQFIVNPTRGQIVANYFSSQFGNRFNYTTAQASVAYYYPVLKEYIIDLLYNPSTTLLPLNFTYEQMTMSEVEQYLIYTFTGIDDPIALAVITANTAALDSYRVLHTFRYSLINQYTCAYNPANNKVTIQTTTLNTSLVNLLNNQYSTYLAQQLGINNITSNYYANIVSINNNLLSVIQTMYDIIQNALASNFGINVGTYSRTYFITLSNTLLLRDGTNATNVSSNYDPNATQITTDIAKNFNLNPTALWTGMTGLGKVEGPPRNMGSALEAFPASSNYPYSIVNSNINFDYNFIDLNGNIYTDNRRKAGDILVDIQPSKYTIFQFRSKVRQTLQVETLPRQTQFRYPAYNAAHYQSIYPITQLYDISYNYIGPSSIGFDTSGILYPVTITPVPGWSSLIDTTSNFGMSFTTSQLFWGSNYDTLTTGNTNGLYYRYETPLASYTGAINKYDFNVTIQSPLPTGFEGSLTAFIYHDIAAFNADVSKPFNENPIHYKFRQTISSSVQSYTFSNTPSGSQIRSYENQQYYMIVRHSDFVQPATTYQVIPWFPSGMSTTTLSTDTNFDPTVDPTITMTSNFNVAVNADPDWIRLPIYSTLYADPSKSSLNDPTTGYASKPGPYDAAINAQTYTSPPPIGYDISGVSNDLTDYILFPPPSSALFTQARYAIDPLNTYVFKYVSPYNTATQSYDVGSPSLPADVVNNIYTRNANAIYTWKPTLADRQYKIAQYYDTTYIADSANVTSGSPSKPYNATTLTNGTIPGYTYDSAGNLNLGNGVCGFTFAPSAGTWTVDRITFKTNHLTTSNVNSNIQYLGIFITSQVSEVGVASINLSNAIETFSLEQTDSFTPSNTTLGFSNYGTYYTFSNVSPTIGSNAGSIYGFSQTTQQFIADINSYYSVVAFDAASNIVAIQNLTGSPNAYPLYYSASAQQTFYDGQSSPTGQGLVVSATTPLSNALSNYGPQGDADFSVSQYQQSLPFVNSHIHYKTDVIDIIYNANAFQPWTTQTRIGTPYLIQPQTLFPSVPGYMMIQKGIFSIMSYDLLSPLLKFTFKTTLTPDQVFPRTSPVAMLAATGNSSSYIFLGVKLFAGEIYGQLTLRSYNPATGFLTTLMDDTANTFNTVRLEIQQFVYNNQGNWFFTALDASASTIYLQGYVNSNMTRYSYPGNTYCDLQMDPTGTNLYFAVAASRSVGYQSLHKFSTVPTATGYFGNGSTGITIQLEGYNAGVARYTQISMSIVQNREQVLLLTDNPVFNTYFYKIQQFIQVTPTQYTTNILQSAQELPAPPQRLYGGGNGSSWIQYTTSPYIYGNRNTSADSAVSVTTAWQIFFPTIKLQLRKLAGANTPMTDLTGLEWPEWPHTATFSYSNYASLVQDISANGGQWGLESNVNFMTSDVSFNGFYFNSYIQSIPLLPNYENGSYETDYYVAIRGYLPTESFQTLVRFSLPNLYDFGYVRIQDMITEISSITNGTIQRSNCTPAYYNNLTAFNSTFILNNVTLGSNSIQSFPGSTITTTGFADFLEDYKGFYITYSTNTVILENIQTNVTSSMNTFILNDLQYILPSTFLTRQRYTDPIVFSILWKSQLQNTFITLEDEWGLGWNLGYTKADTPYSTVANASNIFKIQQDFIYLQLNPEFNINRMDSGSKERYATSREGSGNVNQYYCKLLLTDFGGNANTFFHNPVSFNPPIGKLSRLNFQWVDSNGVQLSNLDADWNMVINITENVGTQNAWNPSGSAFIG